MKVFKIIKYHAIRYSLLFGSSYYTLCSRERFQAEVKLEDYEETMDLCKTCQRVIFERMVNKLKGRYNF